MKKIVEFTQKVAQKRILWKKAWGKSGKGKKNGKFWCIIDRGKKKYKCGTNTLVFILAKFI